MRWQRNDVSRLGLRGTLAGGEGMNNYWALRNKESGELHFETFFRSAPNEARVHILRVGERESDLPKLSQEGCEPVRVRLEIVE